MINSTFDNETIHFYKISLSIVFQGVDSRLEEDNSDYDQTIDPMSFCSHILWILHGLEIINWCDL